MKRTIITAAALAVALFLYGYFMANAGHNHSAHDHGGGAAVFKWLEPLHPKIAHFPIVLFATALFLEMVHFVIKKDVWHESALIVYAAGALLSPLAVRTGVWEVERIGLNHPVLDSHHQFALWTMWISLMSLPVFYILCREYRKGVKPVFACLLLAAVVCAALAGHYGGVMVYDYGVGTAVF